MKRQHVFHGVNEHPEGKNEDPADVARSLLFQFEDRFNRLDFQMELIHKSFSDLASRVSLLLHRLGENPDAPPIQAASPPHPPKAPSPPRGDPIWDAAVREQAEIDKARSKATEIEWGKGIPDAERAEVEEDWKKGISRYYKADDAFAAGEEAKDEADANAMDG